MGLRLFYLGLILFIALWFVAFRPYEVEARGSAGAKVGVERFVYKELDSEGVRIWMAGRRGSYDQKRLQAYKIFVRDANKSETLQADYGLYRERRLDLQGRVRYAGDPYRFYSQKAIYFLEPKKLHVPSRFLLLRPDFNATGSELFYYKKSGKIVAYNIKAKALFQ